MTTTLEEIAQKLNIAQLEDRLLLQAYAAILEELRARGIMRSSNNPVADYTEWLVCSRLRLRQEPKSTAGFDATDESGRRFEIKARRVTSHSESVQLSALRNLAAKHFDYLIGVIYEADFSIRYAAKVPHALIEPNCRFSAHSNAHVFHLTPHVLTLAGVENLTAALAA
jgi:hypothetical protein